MKLKTKLLIIGITIFVAIILLSPPDVSRKLILAFGIISVIIALFIIAPQSKKFDSPEEKRAYNIEKAKEMARRDVERGERENEEKWDISPMFGRSYLIESNIKNPHKRGKDRGGGW